MDIGASNWNEDDNANTTAAPDGAPEGMAPSGVNNVLRAHQGALKRFYNWTIPKITGGSDTAYTLSYAVAPGSLVDGMTHLVQFHTVNGTGATLNVNNLGATPLHYHAAGAWRVAPPGLIDIDEVCRVAYHSSSGAYRLLGRWNRTGEVVPFAGSTAPVGTLLCYGQEISRTTYGGLFATIGTFHGGGDGSTTFKLPDLRGRTVAGKDDMGGGNAGRLNSIASTTLGGAGGAQNETASLTGTATGGITVTSAGMDSENLTNTFSAGSGASQTVAGQGHVHNNVVSTGTATLFVSGSTASANNVQPTMILNYAIRI